MRPYLSYLFFDCPRCIVVLHPNTLGTPVMVEMKKYMVYNPTLGLLTPPADSEEQIILSKIKETVINEQVNLYMASSEEEVEKAYNALIEKIEHMGAEQLIDWANTKYSDVQALME